MKRKSLEFQRSRKFAAMSQVAPRASGTWVPGARHARAHEYTPRKNKAKMASLPNRGQVHKPIRRVLHGQVQNAV